MAPNVLGLLFDNDINLFIYAIYSALYFTNSILSYHLFTFHVNYYSLFFNICITYYLLIIIRAWCMKKKNVKNNCDKKHRFVLFLQPVYDNIWTQPLTHH